MRDKRLTLSISCSAMNAIREFDKTMSIGNIEQNPDGSWDMKIQADVLSNLMNYQLDNEIISDTIIRLCSGCKMKMLH